MSTPLPPVWLHCGHGADPADDPVGCRGAHVPGHTACLAHLPETYRIAYLRGLAPGADIDHRGTPFSEELLEILLTALNDPSTGKPRVGAAWFNDAQFTGNARFDGAQFTSDARFNGAQFTSSAWFDWAQFTSNVWFNDAHFADEAFFNGAQFTSNARFNGARFEGVPVLGPLVCARQVVLSHAVFVLPVTLELAAKEVVCRRTRWESTATVRVRYAAVDLSHAVLTSPVAVISHPTPFTDGSNSLSEDLLTGPDRVQITSVQGVDAAHLVLTDTDLTDCLFSGAFHLDQIRLEGRTTFAEAPTGWHHQGIGPIRYTRRRVLAEEHHWRAHNAAASTGTAPLPHGWRPGPHPTDPARTPDPEDVAALYRQLRKAFEDGKNEPGAADFYYGECGAA
ncbi:pentapeptide repeat-containing protein [Streptomyces geranii]|uniref:pentapeptide repeat-containing protein n=1 Tax=Streptomyces geranii TaxID=2058923 RepID=UPI000D024559|nr:pentapeptide repeat-containing protein [Streptomyces geranii]